MLADGMKFGLFGGPQTHIGNLGPESGISYHEYGEYIVEAEKLGFSSSWLFEHHFSGFGQPSCSLNLLCYFSGITSKIRLGSAVLVIPWHNPILVAEQIGTLDVVSNGRYDFGVGRGYRDNEFRGFGIDSGDAGSIYEESMSLILKAWSERERWSYKSDRWEFNDILIEPRPVQQPHPPLWQGAGSQESIRRAAEQGYGLLLDQILSFDDIGERVNYYKEVVEGLGKVFDPNLIGVTRGFMPADNDKERRSAHQIRNQFIGTVRVLSAQNDKKRGTHNIVGKVKDETEVSEKGAIIGNSDEMIERVQKLYDHGVRNVLLHDLTASKAGLQGFASNVMPEFLNKD